MKQNLLKTCLVMLFAVLGFGMSWAGEETYNFATFTSAQEVTLNATNFTINLYKLTGGSNPAFVSGQARVYAKGSLVVSSGKTITKIVYNYVVNANKNDISPDIDGVEGTTTPGVWDEGTKTWNGSDKEITFSTSGTAGNIGFTSITVTYEDEAGKETTTLAWSAATATVTVDALDNVFPTLTTTPADLTGVTYSSSNPDAATINATTGIITLVDAGATTITASYAGDATHYAAAPVSYALTVLAAPVVDGYTHDVLTNADFAATSTSYADFANVSKNTAVYAGNSSKNNGIQLRSTNSNSGIVSTTSGGKIKKVLANWNSACANGRTLEVYGKHTAYAAASDLYDADTKGTKLGTIVMGTSTELNISSDYEYVGVRSNSGALNLDVIEFVWEEPTTGTLDFVATDEDGYWATFSSTEDVIFDANDVVAYTVAVDGNSLVMIDVNSNSLSCVTDKTKNSGWVAGYYVQAGAAVLINAVDKSVHYYYIDTDPYTSNQLTDVESYGEYNMLRPASVAMEGDYNFYKLAYDNYGGKTGLGFYWGAADGGAFTAKTGGAYLAVPKSAGSVKGFRFDGGDDVTTAIEAATIEKSSKIYNLQGQRVVAPKAGIYVKNGKKIVR